MVNVGCKIGTHYLMILGAYPVSVSALVLKHRLIIAHDTLVDSPKIEGWEKC